MKGWKRLGRLNEFRWECVKDDGVYALAGTLEALRPGIVRGRLLKKDFEEVRRLHIPTACKYDFVYEAIAVGEKAFK
jgi:hypothetical protein